MEGTIVAMRYKDVFKLWLYADEILAMGVTAAAIFSSSGETGDGGILLLMLIILAGFSLPSLIAPSCFYLWYRNKSKSNENLSAGYIAAIVSINFLYFLVSILFFDVDFEAALLYLLTTAAGLFSYFIVYKQKSSDKRLTAID
jgi:NADH:ubiquinone oxidoreductase subunit 3 (subunit A)